MIWCNAEVWLSNRQKSGWTDVKVNKNESEFIPRSRACDSMPSYGQALAKHRPSIGQVLTNLSKYKFGQAYCIQQVLPSICPSILPSICPSILPSICPSIWPSWASIWISQVISPRMSSYTHLQEILKMFPEHQIHQTQKVRLRISSFTRNQKDLHCPWNIKNNLHFPCKI